MKKQLNASKETNTVCLSPISKVESGNLVGFICMDEGECSRLVICRKVDETLELASTLQPNEIEDLARLTAMLAKGLYWFADLDEELGDDLACLGHCLSQTLGLEPVGLDSTAEAIQQLSPPEGDISDGRNLTTKIENQFCECEGTLTTLDSHGSSKTLQCDACRMCRLVVRHPNFGMTIPLADFHLKRGDDADQRSYGDLAMATQLHSCLIDDVWPSSATIVDFGIESRSHLGALQHAIRAGCTAYDLDRVMGDGAAITRLTERNTGPTIRQCRISNAL